MNKLTIAIISGGVSSERDVSIKSGNQVSSALNREKYNVLRYDPKTDLAKLVNDAPRIDAAFIALHGSFGEDGTIQGLLDLLEIPYQGSGVLGSALAINKIASKQIYQQAGILTPAFMIQQYNNLMDTDDCIKKLGLPLVVKPATGGSSLGMGLAHCKESLIKAVETAFEYNNTILIEEHIKGTELTAGVMGNDNLTAFPVVEIIPDKKFSFFDYEAKYLKGAAREICPARIKDTLAQKVKKIAKKAHKALFCRGYSRTDMILCNEKIYVLETNTIPGMTSTSLLPLAAEKGGFSFEKLVEKLLELGIEANKK
ncbi:MAG TPA: D-alanine--D-alanine ligase [Desulfobacteraceae bacterium]|nr:D-alanine--D-alanine ligase [Desulfobacteraceae bacterium]